MTDTEVWIWSYQRQAAMKVLERATKAGSDTRVVETNPEYEGPE